MKARRGRIPVQALRPVIKRCARPVIVRVHRWVDHRIRQEVVPRIDATRVEIAAARASIDSVETYLPDVLSNSSAQNASARSHERALAQHERRLEELDERLRRVEAAVSSPAGPESLTSAAQTDGN